MATLKKKINELTQKENPVLGDSIVISDSENSGRGALVEITDIQTLIGGGGGAVDSVAGKTGVVTLDAADIAETATLKIFTSDERTKLTGIEEGAEVNDVTSVAGKTGAVTLDASDISETETLKILTADERTKLTGIAEGAEVNTVDSVAGRTGVVTLDADDVAPTSTKLWMSDTQSTKLTGIAEGANNYTHPASHPQSMIEGLADALDGKAPLASPALTGTPTAPTAAAGTNTTQLATTAFATALAGNYVQKWTYSYTGVGGAISASAWTMHSFGASGTLTLPLASSVASGVQVAAIVAYGGAEVVLTRSGSDQFLTPTGLAATYTLKGNGSSIVLVRVTASAWACVGAQDSMINAATANAIYDLPVTRSGLVSSGTDKIIFETANEINPAWYDTTHILNVSFFTRNESGVSDNTTFKVQLYDTGTSTAHTIASITTDTLHYNLLQAYIYRRSSGSVNCVIQYRLDSSAGYVSLASGSYKLRVVCSSTLSTIFGEAQVRFTK